MSEAPKHVMLMSEIWRQVVEYEGFYEVSNLGRMRSVDRVDSNGVPRASQIIKPSVNCRSGYLDVGLNKNGKKRFKVHFLVARAFHGEKPHPDSQVRHRDGNKLNNASANLLWGTSRENADDKVLHGSARGERNSQAILDETAVLEIRRRLMNQEPGALIARDLNINKATVYDIGKRRSWSHV